MLKKPLNLRGVQIDQQGAVGAGGGEQVGDELGADGDAGPVLAVLPGVAVVRNDDGDACGRGAFEGVDHDEQFDQVLIDGKAGGLNHENVRAAHVFKQLKVDFAVREALHAGFAERDADKRQTSSARALLASPEKILKRFASLRRPERLPGAALAEAPCCAAACCRCAARRRVKRRGGCLFVHRSWIRVGCWLGGPI